MFSLRASLSARLAFGALTLALTTLAFAEETPNQLLPVDKFATEQTTAGQPPANQPPADQPVNQPPADQPPANQPPPSEPPKAIKKSIAIYNLLQEKSIVYPDIAASNERLSTGGKFQLFVDNSVSVHTITWAILGSAVGQADDSPTGFGEGGEAFGKRFGSSMARQSSSEFFGTFVLASALHEDPRFFAEINPTFFHAVKYSFQRVFITRNDEGRDVKNYSGLLGPLMSEGLANVYWPDRNRTVGDTFFRYGLDLASKAGGNMLREYWPVFYGKVTHAPRPSSGQH